MLSARLDALRASVARLVALGNRLDDDALLTSAYPSEWNVAQVFSHLGSGATILTHMFDDVVHDRDRVDNLPNLVWDEWNAKDHRAQLHEALVADAGLLERFETIDDARRQDFRLSMGPLEVDFTGLVGMRLNEHALHTWDIEVAFDPAATVPAHIAGEVVDNLALVTRYGSKPVGEPRTLHVRTSDPARDLTIEIGAESCAIGIAGEGPADVELPTEAFVRLVYGRLDPEHTPEGVRGDELASLRRIFRGI